MNDDEPGAEKAGSTRARGIWECARDGNECVQVVRRNADASSVRSSRFTAARPAKQRCERAAPSASAAGQQNAQANAGVKGKKPDPQQVQQVKAQHANFRAQPKPQQVPAVTFNQNYRIEGSDRWQGQHYEVFRSYHPEWHDQGWYHSHYQPRGADRLAVTISSTMATGFRRGATVLRLNIMLTMRPIYVGQRAEPPDQVIADVQALLQQMGYYTGEVDGLLGPLTREALTAYQTDQGLTATAVIDQPTLDSLDLA